MDKLYNVWHIDTDGDVYLIMQNEAEYKAKYVADCLQELSYRGRLPGTFYMAVPVDCIADVAWLELMQGNASKPSVDYIGTLLTEVDDFSCPGT